MIACLACAWLFLSDKRHLPWVLGLDTPLSLPLRCTALQPAPLFRGAKGCLIQVPCWLFSPSLTITGIRTCIHTLLYPRSLSFFVEKGLIDGAFLLMGLGGCFFGRLIGAGALLNELSREDDGLFEGVFLLVGVVVAG